MEAVSSTVCYCWLCEAPVEDLSLQDRHYDSGRLIVFCSPRHLDSYRQLDSL